jgi:hypothetical protein
VVIVAPTQHVMDGLEMMKTYGLFPRDAIHVSITKLSGITNLITTNRDNLCLDFIIPHKIKTTMPVCQKSMSCFFDNRLSKKQKNVYTCNPEALKLIAGSSHNPMLGNLTF